MIVFFFFLKKHTFHHGIHSVHILEEFWMPIIIIYSFDIFHHPLPLKKKTSYWDGIT